MKVKRKRILQSVTLFLSIPVILFLIFSCVNAVSFANNYQTMLTSSYATEFNNFLHATENSISEILSAYTTLFSNPDVKAICSIGVDKNSLSQSSVISAQSALLNFSIQNPDLYNIFLVNRSGNFIISSTGVYEPTYFFKSIYSYKDYSSDFWMNYSPKSSQFDTLAPTSTIQNDNSKQNTIPVVIPVSNSNIAALAVFNVSLDAIYDSFKSYSFTTNTEFLINNNSSEASASSKINLSDAETIAAHSYYNISKLKSSGNKYLILSSLERSNIFGCTYAVKIPYSDINSYTYSSINKLPFFALIILFLLLAYIYWGSKKFSSPWLTLADKLSVFNENEDSANDLIRTVDDAVTNLISDNSALEHNLSVSLSHGKQKYLTDLLNNSDTISDDNMNSLIFQKDYFISVVLKISFKKGIDQQLASIEQLSSKLYETIESLFAAKFMTFPLRGTNSTYTLILNTDSPDNDAILSEICSEILSMFSQDKMCADIFIGCGNTYKSVDGLRISHQEALSDFFDKIDNNKVHIYNQQNINKYSLNLHYESILTNHMLLGSCQSAIEFVNNIFLTYSDKPDYVKKQIYSDILRIIHKVCLLKNIEIPVLSDDIEYNIENHTDEDILTYITNTLCAIDTMSSHTATKGNVSEITEYINANYTKDICLDDLAKEFNSTPKYISKILKQHLGIPFKTYLTQLKMNKAEELLRDKTIPIVEISKAVGFLNHSSFIRAFKQKNGISPNEYRNLYIKK